MSHVQQEYHESWVMHCSAHSDAWRCDVAGGTY